MWASEIGFEEDVIRFALEQWISVYNRDVAPEKDTIDQYTKFLKEAGILEADDEPKFDSSFAKKALE